MYELSSNRVWRALLVVAGFVFGGSMSTAHAATGAWQVGKMSGHATMRSPQSAPSDLAVGAEVPDGMTVYTDSRARVLLSRGSEAMMIGPQSVVAVGPGAAPGLDTTVVQRAGTVTFEVETLNHPHFSIETPTLAAVVKGTHFTVRVSQRRADVAVFRGLVGVTNLVTGQTTNISPGQRAGVDSRGGMSVSGIGTAPAVGPAGSRAATDTETAPTDTAIASVTAVSNRQPTAVSNSSRGSPSAQAPSHRPEA